MSTTVGLFLHHSLIATDPEIAAATAARTEELGYDSLWAGEHMVVPSPRVAPSPMEPDEPILDPLVLLAHLACTSRIRLATGVVVLPQRNPLVLAKQVASLDVLSRGRIVLGIGAGYLEPELAALGVPMAERGARTDEYLAAMRVLWEDPAPGFDGRFVQFAGVDAHPRPVQRPLPVVIGGASRGALRRAARHAQGWYGFLLSPEVTAKLVAVLREAETEAGRGPLHVSVTPDRRLDAEVVRAYATAGADRLVVAAPPRCGADVLEQVVEANAPSVLGATTG